MKAHIKFTQDENKGAQSPFDVSHYLQLCQKWGVEHDEHSPLLLCIENNNLTLKDLNTPKQGGVFVDFIGGKNAHRRQFGGGKSQLIAKAVGIGKFKNLHILDATAGLGADAFVLASLGCKLDMIERHPLVGTLLEDGVNRSKLSDDPLFQHAFNLHPPKTQISDLIPTHNYDVVYLDPMYPKDEKRTKKSALPKKEMRLFQQIVGQDLDADLLLAPALKIATKRVVVKRPSYASFLNNQKPTLSLTSPHTRFDIYVTLNQPAKTE